MYHDHRVFIRLQHRNSLDYNSSPPALTNDEQSWIYYAHKITMIDSSLISFSLTLSVLFILIDSVAAIVDKANVCIEIRINKFAIFFFFPIQGIS